MQRASPRYIQWLLVSTALVIGLLPLVVFLVSPGQPLLEHHAFRQTQTALTSYWLARGGPLLDYLTPVVGYPWTVPMEFPFFQKLVAALSGALSTPLDVTGRALSLTFFYLFLLPLALLLARHGRAVLLLAAVMLFTGPVDLFFARTFLIETLATLLALLALYAYVMFVRSGRAAWLALFAVAGSLAGLQKITTFLPVLAVCMADASLTLLRGAMQHAFDLRRLVPMFLLGVAVVPPLWWTIHSDAIKAAGLLSSNMTSQAVREFSFGTLSQRLDWYFWLKLGVKLFVLGGLLPGLLLAVLARLRGKALINREACLFIAAGVLGPVVFGNLHFVHDYYQVGSVAFLVFGLCIIAAPLVREFLELAPGKYLAILWAVVLCNLVIFGGRYWPMLNRVPADGAVSYQIAQVLREEQAQEEVVLIVGLDWDSTIPYYAQRRAVMVPDWIPNRDTVLGEITRLAGGRGLGSVVYCLPQGDAPVPNAAEQQRLFALLDGEVRSYGNCKVKVKVAGRPPA